MLDCQLIVLTPIPSENRCYLQYMEMLNYKKLSIHQPIGLKTKSCFKKIELLDGIVSVYGADKIIADEDLESQSE